jgi:hypothetical protein
MAHAMRKYSDRCTHREICCSGVEAQEGFSKLVDVGILINPNGRYTWQIVCYSAPRTAVSCSRSHKGTPLRLAWESS